MKNDVLLLQNQGYVRVIPNVTESLIEALLSDYKHLCVQYPVFASDGVMKYGVQKYWNDLGSSQPWFKSLHVYSKCVRELAQEDQIVTLVKSILGEEIVLWGAQMLVKQPGENHRWHVDVETLEWASVNVWIALENVSSKSCLKIITKSDEFGEIPQTLKRSKEINLQVDSEVLREAKRLDDNACIVSANVLPGQAIVFKGKTWHASQNLTKSQRIALLLQYAHVSAGIKIPMNFSPPVKWHSVKPPLLSIKKTTSSKML